MRIGLLTWAYPPEKSGLSRAAREIAESLAEAGHDVRVLTFDRSGREQVGGVEVVGVAPAAGSRAAAMRRYAAVGHLVGPWLFGQAVAAEHRRRPFDVVEATNWYAPGLFVAGVPLIVRNSSPVATTAQAAPRLRDRIDLAAARLAERVAARRARGLISNTAAHGAKIAALYGVASVGPRHAVIGLSLPAAIVARGRAAAYPDPDGRGVRLLFVGRPEHRKGFDALLAALDLLAADGIAFDARLIGVEAADLAALSPAARARLSSWHRVSDADLHDALAWAHVVMAPSRYESFGLVYQEAMAFGRPILACAEDASARLFVSDTGAGVLATDCSGAAIVAALRPLVVDPARRAAVAAASRAAAGRFDRATLARDTLALYGAVSR